MEEETSSASTPALHAPRFLAPSHFTALGIHPSPPSAPPRSTPTLASQAPNSVPQVSTSLQHLLSPPPPVLYLASGAAVRQQRRNRQRARPMPCPRADPCSSPLVTVTSSPIAHQTKLLHFGSAAFSAIMLTVRSYRGTACISSAPTPAVAALHEGREPGGVGSQRAISSALAPTLCTRTRTPQNTTLRTSFAPTLPACVTVV